MSKQKTVEFDLNQNNSPTSSANNDYLNLPQSSSKMGLSLPSPTQSNRFKNLSKTMKNVISFTASNTPTSTPIQLRKHYETQVTFYTVFA